MSIIIADPLDGIDEDTFEEEGGTQYNMRELMDQVYEHKDLIITLPTEEVPVLKQGLITRKAKDNTKLKDNGIIVTGDVLSFLVYPSKTIDGASDVRIKLGPKKSVQVLNIQIPADNF